jgi:hypothetical protein
MAVETVVEVQSFWLWLDFEVLSLRSPKLFRDVDVAALYCSLIYEARK